MMAAARSITQRPTNAVPSSPTIAPPPPPPLQFRQQRRRLRSKSVVPTCLKLVACAAVFYIVMMAYFFSLFESKASLIKNGNEANVPSSSGGIQDTDKSTTKSTPKAGDGPPMLHNSSNKRPPHSFSLDVEKAEAYLKANGPLSIRKVISAYLEPPMNDTVPGTGRHGEIEDDSDPGFPPDFVTPLPLRETAPSDLKKYEYPKFQTCHDLPGKLPVDRGLELDKSGKPVVWNVGNDPLPEDYPWLEAPHCPVDADPYLPWIHDMFPSQDGAVIDFIAHNKRRCKTGKKYKREKDRLQPQVALLQPVSVERIGEERARELAPDLWQSDEDLQDNEYRYRLAPYGESAEDGQETRFICRFFGVDFTTGEPRSVLIDEVLSIYPFNYEFVSYRKGKPTMLTPKGKDNQYFWTSVLRFQCPVPKTLQRIVRNGKGVLSDGTPILHIDLVPIRTPPRFGNKEVYFTEDMAGPKSQWALNEKKFNSWHDTSKPSPGFDAKTRWGDRNVLPRVEASGRWANLPICQRPKRPESATDSDKVVPFVHPPPDRSVTKKPHMLSACLWASTSFTTRGSHKNPIMDTQVRLKEWIEFHLMVGFDHIYVYDNSGAHTNQTSLAPILDKYPKSQITRIDWPSIICNNNIPAHDSTGERSSQYTAENSCRTRHAPFTEWIASFDTDEYMIPMGDYTSLRDVLRDAQKKKANILSFRSSRARLRYDKSYNEERTGYRAMLSNYTYMEAYSCDSAPIPKPEWGERARKQIYRADYVPYHYVHYSTVTNGYLVRYKDDPKHWRRIHNEHAPSERRSHEDVEATMLHTKTTEPQQTSRWQSRCHYQFEKKWRGCFVGFPWPDGKEDAENNHRADGMEYNCFEQPKIIDYWIPRLKAALAQRREITEGS